MQAVVSGVKKPCPGDVVHGHFWRGKCSFSIDMILVYLAGEFATKNAFLAVIIFKSFHAALLC